MGIKGFHHVAIKAIDFDRSKEFYTEVLGLKQVNAWGAPGSRAVMLACDDNSRIELFEGGEHIENQASPILHFAFNVDSPDKFVEAVRDFGCKITTEPNTVNVQGTPGFSTRMAFCEGPNGEVIEFFTPLA